MTKNVSDNRATIFLQPELMAFARQQAAREGRSLSNFIAAMLSERKNQNGRRRKATVMPGVEAR